MTISSSLSTGEIAKHCDVNLRTVIRWIERGALKGYKLPGRGNNRVKKEDFISFLKTNNMPLPTNLNEEPNRPCVLIVDDEKDILNSIKRILRKCEYTLLLAESGEQALSLLQEHNVDLIMSDMRMPGMSGAELLEKAAVVRPDAHRIILTGYSDMESTVAAINLGKVHRFMQKPWDNQALVETIEAGLEQVKLKQENNKLQAVVLQQNTLLKKLNHNLEDKVELRTKQIRATLKTIEKRSEATQQMLFNFISINPELSGSFAISVSQLAGRIGMLMGLPQKQIEQISYAGLLNEVGLLGLPKELLDKPFSELNYAQQTEFLSQTEKAGLILGPASHLQPVTEILTCQYEYFNGTGSPNKLSSEEIPLGARILAVARDFWRYKQQRICAEEVTDIDVRTKLKQYSGTRYDPQIIELLIKNREIVSDDHLNKSVPTSALEPGMTLKKNILNSAHILILPKGHEFTEDSIKKLQVFERTQEKALSIVVEKD